GHSVVPELSTLMPKRPLPACGGGAVGHLWAMLNASLALTLLVSPIPVTHLAPTAPSPDDFFENLQVPVEIENVDIFVEVSDDIHLGISYELPEVGRVSVTVHGEEDGSGFGFVTVGDAIVTEVGVVDGALVRERADLTDLSPAEAHAVAASVFQIWHEDAVTRALSAVSFESRDVKCQVAGGIAG